MRLNEEAAAVKTSFETSPSFHEDDESISRRGYASSWRSRSTCQGILTAVVLVVVFGVLAVLETKNHDGSNTNGDETAQVLQSQLTSESSPTFLEYTETGKITWAARRMPPPGSLLDPVIDHVRQENALEASFLAISAPDPSALQNCSCLTVMPDVWSITSKTPDPCCDRVYIRGHKMGVQLTSLLFRNFDFHNRYQPLNAEHWITAHDIRVVVIVRNIYEALVSGYLYHKQGRECYTDPNGLPLRDKQTHKRKVGHTNYINFTTFIDVTTIKIDSNGNQQPASNLCQYIIDESVENGMRAYIDFVFRGDYYSSSLLAWWVASQSVNWMRDRTHLICYENLTTNRTAALSELLAFYYPSGVPHSVQVRAKDAGRLQMLASPKHNGTYSGPHATNHDAELRESLIEVVLKLDDEYYDGQIAFMDTMIPCGK